MGRLIEDLYPPILSEGFNTNKNITVAGSANFDMSGSTGTFKTPTGALTLGGSVTISGTGTLTTGTGAVALNGNTTVATAKTLAVTDTAALTVGGVIVPQYEYITSPLLAAATFANGSSYPLYTFPNDGTTWKCVFASLRFTVAASAAATCQVYLDASGTAPGAGTAQFDTMLLNGAANTVVNAANPVGTTSAAGGAISIKAATQATTGLVNLVVTVAIQRLS